jgi:phosphopantothenoylcysteine decarboxylase
MNTHMYSHPLTSRQLDILQKEIGYNVVGPIAKTLACGDTGEFDSDWSGSYADGIHPGLGAMSDWRDIVAVVEDHRNVAIL